MASITPATMIPPTQEIRERLANVATERRLLRQLLKLATDRDKVAPQQYPQNEQERGDV